MNDRGQFILALSGIMAATLLAVLGVISGETWVAFLVGAAMPSPLGRARPPGGLAALGLACVLGACVPNAAEVCLVGHVQQHGEPRAQGGVAADYVRMGAQASLPAACSGFGCLYTKNSDNLPRLVDVSGNEYIAGTAWRARQYAGTPGSVATGDVWHDTNTGYLMWRSGGGNVVVGTSTGLPLTTPVLSGTITGTYSLGGTPSLAVALAAGGFKITGLGQGTASGEAIHAGRSISTTAPLSGGGDLTANRTLSISYSSSDFDVAGGALIIKGGSAVYQTISGGASGVLGAQTIYLGATNANPTSTEYYQAIAPRAGLARTLRCYLQVAPGGADTVVVTARISGADTTLTCTITGAAQTCADTTHAPTVAAGDRLSTKAVSSAGTAASITCSWEVTN